MTQNDHRGGGRKNSIHEEAIKRFLQKLDSGAVAALPSELSVQATCLVITVLSEPYARALLLSSDIFIKAAGGLFDRIRFVWGEGKWSCPFFIPQENLSNDN
jgi:hypothetical protein